MITNFALSLSFDGIELLHRVPRGWRRVGQANVASPTLDDDLRALRDKALKIEPDGLRSKLVLPRDQIKYLAIDSTLTTDVDIAASLEGQTPYALDELVIDSEKFGGRTHIAAVARETLQEAEAFAAGHGFQPVAFVAVPEPFTFQKEIFFGPTGMARDIVGPDAVIDRDELPVMIVGTRIKSRLLVMDPPEEIGEDVYKDDLAALLDANDSAPDQADASIASQPDEEPQLSTPSALELAPQQVIWIDQIPAEFFPPVADITEPVTAPVRDKVALIPADPVFAVMTVLDPVIAEYHPAQPIAEKTPLVAVAARGLGALPKPGVPAPAANRTSAPPVSQLRRKPALIAGGIAAGVLAVAGVIWSQQSSQEVAAPPVAESSVTIAQAPQTPVPVVVASPAAPVAQIGPSIPGFAVASFGAQDNFGADVPRFGPETFSTPMTPPVALSAADADASLSPIQPPPAPPTQETAEARVAAPISRGQVQSPAEAARIYAATGVWLRAPRFYDVPSGAILFNFQPPEPAAMPERVALPGALALDGSQGDLSFISPASPPPPDVTFARDADGFILATEEGTVTPDGAVVYAGLPDIAITLRPELTQDDLDRMALLAPAPEDVIIIAGRPDVVPPLRPADARLPAGINGAEVTDPVGAALDQATSGTEAPTPGSVGIAGLTLQNSGAIAVDPAQGAIVDLRPRLRPGSLRPVVDPGTPDITDILAGIAAEDAAQRFDNSTSLAIALSPRPNRRPSSFGAVVAAARARQQAPAVAAAPVRAAAPVPPQNFEPVPGGVAHAATLENAIQLHDINLIGVYGRPNARRALVRLGNGRYVRVEVGSALDGGQVTAIGAEALNYVKRGRTYAIELPSG